MSIEQTIYDVIELSRHSQVPFLLMSNPGYGKTTIINKWAKENGYHVEVLIGSRFSPEEIMGYQVNEPGSTHLVHKNPEWYDRVMAKAAEGIPTLLFEDEISTCPDFVQGALLDLNFSRSIGAGNKLPDDCLVIAAANYAGNLPGSMNLITPNINRFCIVNLLEGMSTLDIFDEFMKPSKGAITRQYNPFDEETSQKFDDAAYKAFKDLVIKYSDKGSSLGYIDLQNTEIGDVYAEANGALYNIFTGRSVSYLRRATKALAECGITDKEMCFQIGAGFAGLGTNNFENEIQAEGWRKALSNVVYSLARNFVGAGSTETLNLNGTVAEVIQRFLQDTQKTTITSGSMSNVPAIMKKIVTQYGNIIETDQNFLEKAPSDEDKAKYVSDLDSIREFYEYLEGVDSSMKEIHELKKIHMSHLSNYCDFTNLSLQAFNLNDTYGIDAPKTFQELRVVKLTDSERNKKRPSLFIQVARLKRGDRESFFEVNLEKAANLAAANLSASLAKNNIERVVSFN